MDWAVSQNELPVKDALARLDVHDPEKRLALLKHPLSVYVTGSCGRLEAWAGSDTDLFFLHGHRWIVAGSFTIWQDRKGNE
jgi:hypothetical protein